MTVGSSTGSSAAHGSGRPLGSRSSGSTQPVAAAVEATPRPRRRRRARGGRAVFVAPSHHAMSASVPGPKRAQPAAHQLGVALLGLGSGAGTSPSQSDIASTAAARSASGRRWRRAPRRLDAELGQHPRARSGSCRRTSCRGASSIRPASCGHLLAQLWAGRARRRPGGRPRPPGRVEPGRAVVGEPGGLDLLRQPGARAGRRPGPTALPHAAGSRSRGKTKSVRRIASCLTSERSSYSARSTSATVEPVDPGAQRQVDRGRLGGVQDRHRPGRRHRVGDAARPGRARAARQPGPPLVVRMCRTPPSLPEHIETVDSTPLVG